MTMDYFEKLVCYILVIDCNVCIATEALAYWLVEAIMLCAGQLPGHPLCCSVAIVRIIIFYS